MRKPALQVFTYSKTRAQISCARTADQRHCFRYKDSTNNPNFQTSSHLLWLYSPVCVGPGQKFRRQIFSRQDTAARTERKLVMQGKQLVYGLLICVSIGYMRLQTIHRDRKGALSCNAQGWSTLLCRDTISCYDLNICTNNRGKMIPLR